MGWLRQPKRIPSRNPVSHADNRYEMVGQTPSPLDFLHPWRMMRKPQTVEHPAPVALAVAPLDAGPGASGLSGLTACSVALASEAA